MNPETFFIPKDFVGDYSEGDEIKLKVLGEDEEGDLEVVCVHPEETETEETEEPEDYNADMRMAFKKES